MIRCAYRASTSSTWKIKRPHQANVGRHDRVGQLVQRRAADLGEHVGDVGWRRPDVPAHEGVGMLEWGAHAETAAARWPEL